MHPRTLLSLALLCATIVATTALLTDAGPLSPPAGPVASTHKTLTEVEPRTRLSAATTPGDADSVFRIIQPGSYYLTGNLAVPAARSGIEIAAGDVTIDLNGFRISGVAGSLAGVVASVAVESVRVRNGSVSALGLDGVDLGNASFSRVEAITVHDCGGDGIRVASRSLVTDCAVSDSAGRGIVAGTDSTVARSSAHSCGGGGFVVGSNCIVTDCTSTDNVGAGFVTNAYCLVASCLASNNTGDGFLLNSSDTVVRDCTAQNNGANGFSMSSGRIEGCDASGNALNGIVLRIIDAIALNNRCDDNVLAGIHVLLTRCRIQGNLCTANGTGIDVDVAGNFIVQNTCSANAVEYAFTGVQTAGPIIGAGPIASTNPWANFDF